MDKDRNKAIVCSHNPKLRTVEFHCTQKNIKLPHGFKLRWDENKIEIYDDYTVLHTYNLNKEIVVGIIYWHNTGVKIQLKHV